MDQIAQAMTNFQISVPTLIASRTADDGELRIEGVASSTVRDHHGDEITEKALRKMAGSAVGMTIFLNHEYRVPQDVFGVVEKAKVVKSADIDKRTGNPIYDMRVGIRVAKSNPEAVNTFDLIESDAVKLGISIGAMVPEGGATFAKSGGGRYIVDDADLVEASIISLPANSRSWVDHVVKALAGLDDFATIRGGKENPMFIAKRLELLEAMGPDEVAIEAELGDVVELTEDGTTVIAKAGSPEAETLTAQGPVDLEILLATQTSNGFSGEVIIKEVSADDFVPEEPESDAPEEGATEEVEDPPEDLEKTRVSVWKDNEVIEIDTGRSKSKADEDPTPQAEPENEGGPEGASVIKAIEDEAVLTPESMDPLVKAYWGQLNAAKAENVELRKERDVALEVAQRSLEGARAIVNKLAELPVGRKTQSGQFVDPELLKADEALDRLGGVYDADVIKMLKK